MFKPGDMVIRVDGGNKMRVTESDGGRVTCIWATDVIQTDVFSETELLPVHQFQELARTHTERDEKLTRFLGDDHTTT